MTAEEFLRWVDRPENVGSRWELVRGVPTELPVWPPALDALKLRLAARIGEYVIRRGVGAVAFLDDGLITTRDPDTVRRPAVMVFTTPAVSDDFPPRFTTEVPALVVELQAPGESFVRPFRRITEYVVGFGVPMAWVFHAADTCVTVFRPKQMYVVLDETDVLTGNGTLPDFTCPVRALFPPTPTP